MYPNCGAKFWWESAVLQKFCVLGTRGEEEQIKNQKGKNQK
jgi:hypothetical protein